MESSNRLGTHSCTNQFQTHGQSTVYTEKYSNKKYNNTTNGSVILCKAFVLAVGSSSEVGCSGVGTLTQNEREDKLNYLT